MQSVQAICPPPTRTTVSEDHSMTSLNGAGNWTSLIYCSTLVIDVCSAYYLLEKVPQQLTIAVSSLASKIMFIMGWDGTVEVTSFSGKPICMSTVRKLQQQ